MRSKSQVVLYLFFVWVLSACRSVPVQNDPVDDNKSAEKEVSLQGGDLPVTELSGAGRLSVQIQGKDNLLRPDDLPTLSGGQKFRIHYIPSRPGYIYIVSQTTSGEFEKLYPARGVEESQVQVGSRTILPSNDLWFILPSRAAEHQIMVLLSEQKIMGDRAIISTVQSLLTPGSSQERSLRLDSTVELDRLNIKTQSPNLLQEQAVSKSRRET